MYSEVLDSEAHAPACACENGATVSGYRSSSQAPGEGANLGYENFLSAKDPATPPEPQYFLFSFHAFCWTTYKRRAIFRPSNGTLKAKIMGYSHRASRKSPVGRPQSAQVQVTANFYASFKTKPCGKSGEIGPSCVVKWEKCNSHRASTRFYAVSKRLPGRNFGLR
jgi:hypothetical protein